MCVSIQNPFCSSSNIKKYLFIPYGEEVKKEGFKKFDYAIWKENRKQARSIVVATSTSLKLNQDYAFRNLPLSSSSLQSCTEQLSLRDSVGDARRISRRSAASARGNSREGYLAFLLLFCSYCNSFCNFYLWKTQSKKINEPKHF